MRAPWKYIFQPDPFHRPNSCYWSRNHGPQSNVSSGGDPFISQEVQNLLLFTDEARRTRTHEIRLRLDIREPLMCSVIYPIMSYVKHTYARLLHNRERKSLVPGVESLTALIPWYMCEVCMCTSLQLLVSLTPLCTPSLTLLETPEAS